MAAPKATLATATWLSSAVFLRAVMRFRPDLRAMADRPLALREWFRFLATACPECGVLDEAVLTVLETVGFANAIPSCVEALTRVVEESLCRPNQPCVAPSSPDLGADSSLPIEVVTR